MFNYMFKYSSTIKHLCLPAILTDIQKFLVLSEGLEEGNLLVPDPSQQPAGQGLGAMPTPREVTEAARGLVAQTFTTPH